MSQIDRSSEDYKNFLKAYEFTAKWEGGFSDHADDYGGRTYKGVTQGSWETFVSQNPQYSNKDVATLTEQEIHDFYYLDRWKKVGLDDSVPFNLARVIFDSSVNFGTSTAWAFVNEVVNPQDPKYSMSSEDQTRVKKQVLEGIKEGKYDVDELVKSQLERRLTQHHQIADSDPSQKSFIDGWENRVQDLASASGVGTVQKGEPINYDESDKSSSSNSSSSDSSSTSSDSSSSDSTSSSSSGGPIAGNLLSTGGSIINEGMYMIKAAFDRFPLVENMRVRKVFGGYQLDPSKMIGVGAVDKVGGPGVGDSKGTQSGSNSSSDNSNVDFDYGGTWGDPLPSSNSVLTSGYQQSRWERPHPGIDISAGGGTEVVASADGVVADISLGYSGGFGNLVVLSHKVGDETLYTQYNHMEDGSIVVNKNDKVKRGQKLGTEGMTGYSKGAHLHFELRNSFSDSRANFLSTHYDASCVIERWKSHCSYNQANGATMMPPTPSPSDSKNNGELSSTEGTNSGGEGEGTSNSSEESSSSNVSSSDSSSGDT